MSSIAYESAPFEADYEADYEGWGDPEAWEPEAPRRSAPRQAPARPPRTYAPQPQQSGGFVTQAQLQSALTGVRSDMEKNAGAIRSVGVQVDALGTRTRREIAKLRDETKNTMQMLALIPMLTRAQPVTVAKTNVTGAQILPAGQQLAGDTDGMSSLLPLLLIGGLGGGSSSGSQSGGSGFGGGDNSLILVLALTMMNRPQQQAQVPVAT